MFRHIPLWAALGPVLFWTHPLFAQGENQPPLADQLKATLARYETMIERVRDLAKEEPDLAEAFERLSIRLEEDLRGEVAKLVGGTAPSQGTPPTDTHPARSSAGSGGHGRGKPTLDSGSAVEDGMTLHGNVPELSPNLVMDIQVDDKSVGMVGTAGHPGANLTGKFELSGDFEVSLPSPLKAGQQIVACLVAGKHKGLCSNRLSVLPLPPSPILKTPLLEGGTSVSGSASPSSKAVVVKVDDKTVKSSKPDNNGTFDIRIPPLRVGQKVEALQQVGTLSSKPSEAVEVQAAGYEWGRVRANFSSGVEFSQGHDDFSQQDLFLRFELDKNWRLPGRLVTEGEGSGVYFNTFFDTIVAAIPVVGDQSDTSNMQSQSSSGRLLDKGSGNGDAGSGGNGPSTPPADFLSSRKAATLRVGAYLPVVLNFMQWDFGGKHNALFFAPFGKAGVETITGNDSARAGDPEDDVFNFWAVGVRLGHFAFERNGNHGLFAPNSVSYFDASVGRFESFDLTRHATDSQGNLLRNDAGELLDIRVRPFRYNFEGQLKIPELPLNVGFSANVGKGPDDIRFFFGTRFDIGKLFSRLKGIEEANKKQE